MIPSVESQVLLCGRLFVQAEALIPIAMSCDTVALGTAIACMGKCLKLRACYEDMLTRIARGGKVDKLVFLLQHAVFGPWLKEVSVCMRKLFLSRDDIMFVL